MRRGDHRILIIHNPSLPPLRPWSELVAAEMPGQGALALAGSELSPIDDAEAREHFLREARAL
jgi:hypothetical protein